MAKGKKKRPCALCLVAQAEARLDQAHDAMADMLESGVVVAPAATMSSVRLEEARFWIGRLTELARVMKVQHRKACATG